MSIVTKAQVNVGGSLIGYNNLLASSLTSHPEVLTPNTYERITPASGAFTGTWDMGALLDVNFIAIAAHTLSGETLLIQTSTDNITYVDVESITPADNSAIFITFDTRNVRYLEITSTLIAAQEIGVIYMGSYLEMQRPLYGGHAPIDLQAETEYQNVMSESGQFLGRTIKRKGLESSYSYQFLDDAWVRETFKPFIESARTLPFFIQWRPDYYDAPVFGYTTKDIKPTNMGGGKRLMQVSFDVKAHADL